MRPGARIESGTVTTLPIRETARLILVDSAGSILLVRYDDGRPGRPPYYWATPGGALEAGETHRAAAQRELREETGLEGEIGPEVWKRTAVMDHGQGPVEQTEKYFLVKLTIPAPAVANTSPENISELRWWRRAEITVTRDTIYPEGFARLLSGLGV